VSLRIVPVWNRGTRNLHSIKGHYIQWTQGPGTEDPGTRDLGPGDLGPRDPQPMDPQPMDPNWHTLYVYM